jgi:hypothetical protein
MNALEAGRPYSLGPYVWLDATLSLWTRRIFPGRDSTVSTRVRNLGASSGVEPGFAGIDYPLMPRLIMLQLEQQL